MLYQLSKPSEVVLRAIQKLGNATLKDVFDAAGVGSKPAVYSLKKCWYVQVEKTLMRVTSKAGKSESKPVSVFSLTEKGHAAIRRMDLPPVKNPLKPNRPELYTMQYFTIPDRDPNVHHVHQMMAEIGGRMVKITYGVHHDYEVYRPAPDQSRNYTPKPLRSILAM